jgi:hypothetical protein
MTIKIPEAGNILALVPVYGTLIVMTNNGVWSIGGGTGGFKATDFSVTKLTSAGVLSRSCWVEVEGTVYWLSENGIFRIQIDQISGTPTPVNITDPTIRSFYNDIPTRDKADSVGFYDTANKVVSWLYKDTTTADGDNTAAYYYNRVLHFNTNLNAFYTWSVSSTFNSTPYIAGVFSATVLEQIGEATQVIVTNLDTVVVTSGDLVVAGSGTFSAQSTYTRYLVVVPDDAVATDNNITFALFSNKSFTDWETYDTIENGGTGIDYDSYLLTGFDLQGDMMRQKQAPYIITHCKRTENQYVYDDDNNLVFDYPSGLYLQARWDWSDHGNSGKWSSTQQVYRQRRHYIPDEDNLDYEPGNLLVTAKSRIRGKGRALQLKFSSESGKDFNLLGWGIVYTGNSEV